MFTKEDFLNSIAHEVHVCKHIFSKASPSQADYRPAEGIRSNLELMQYLSCSASLPTEALIKGDWSMASKAMEESSTMKWEEFPARMDAQLESVRSMIAAVPDEEFMTREAALPWGASVKLGAGLVDTSLKFMSAYRLQFFQNVKVSGAKDMNTANAWLGVDKP